MSRGYIYKWTNTVTNEIYIGKSINHPYLRAGVNGRNYKGTKLFYPAILEYGFSTFELDILWDIVDNDFNELWYKLGVLEKIEISNNLSNVPGVGYNVSIGSIKEMDQQTKDRISKTMSGRQITWSNKIKEAHIKRASLLPKTAIKHGTASAYSNRKCRCLECTKAWNMYISAKRLAKKVSV